MSTEQTNLTERQQAFIDEYMVDMNGTKAAIRAGYSEKGAAVTGSQLLTNPKIREAIELKKQERREFLMNRFAEEAENAFAVMLSIMNDPEEKGQTRYNAAKDIMDRAGYKPGEKVEHSGNTTIEVTDTKEQLLARLHRLPGPVIETKSH